MVELNGTLRDQAERLRSLEIDESFIVQAPAGSGKTELLIQRFLTLLSTVDQPERIFAITFTRKAASEMRQRVMEALENASAYSPESEHEQFTLELARAALARDEELGWNLLEHPSRLRIQTIDSLCSRLVRQMPWISRMGAPPKPEENVEYLYRRVVQAMLDLLYSDDRKSELMGELCSHLDNNIKTIEGLLVKMLARRDQWLRHVVLDDGWEGFRDAMESGLEEITREVLEKIIQFFPQEIIAETIAVANYAAMNLDKDEMKTPLASCLNLNSLPGTDVESLRMWLGLTEMFLTETGERRKQLNRKQGFPAGKEGKDAKTRALAIQIDDVLVEQLHELRSLPPSSLADNQWKILDCLVQLLPHAVAELKLVFEDEGVVDFTEVAHAARTALGSFSAPTDLSFILDCGLQHLLLDEFQDTSQSQYQLIRRLTEEWEAGDGRTLFLVGDPMQSIYGFREAEVGLFMKARREGIGNVRLIPLKLSVNFRSDAGIVEWVNRVLEAPFPNSEDSFTGAVLYEPSFPFDPVGSDRSVFIHPFFDSDPAFEAERVLEIIRDSRSKIPNGTIAVLVRSRKDLYTIVRALRLAGERFQAIDIDALGERPVVQDLLALTRALLYPGDRIAWLAILRAPWCGLTLADLDILVSGDFSSAISDLLFDSERLARMSNDGQTRIERIAATLKETITRRGKLQLRRWVEETWIELGGPACLEDETDLEDAAGYLDLLEESVLGGDLRDERKFIGDVTTLFARPNVEMPNLRDEGALQLLTIHKAKGLEFDTVILPGLGRVTRSESKSLMMSLEYIDAKGDTQLLLSPIQKSGSADDDPLYAYLRKVQRVRREHESTRLLYVGATRARKRLHLVGHTGIDAQFRRIKLPHSRSLLHKIWRNLEVEFERTLVSQGFAERTVKTPTAIGSTGIPLRRLSLNWSAPNPSEEIIWTSTLLNISSDDESTHPFINPVFDWATEVQRRVGIVVHAILQRLSVNDQDCWGRERIRAALLAEGLEGIRLKEGVKRVKRALEGILSDEKGLWVLSKHEDDQREYHLSGVIAGRVRRFVLDRTFIDDNVRWIIDYKVGIHEGVGLEDFLDNEQIRYRGQLENYASVMKHIESRRIRLGLYFPLLQGWREWEFEPLP